MVTRTGLPDTPDIITPAQRVSAPVAQNMGAAWEMVAQFTDDINRRLEPALKEEGLKKAAKAAAKGDYRKRVLPMNAIDDGYNAGIESAYLAKTGMDVESIIAQAALEHPEGENGEGLALKLQDAKSAYLESVRPEYALAVGQKFDALAQRAVLQAEGTYRDVQTKGAFETLKTRRDQLIDQLTSVNSIESALASPDGDVERSPLAEFTAITDQMANNPAFAKFGYTAGSAADDYARLTSRIVANGYAESAVRMATDGNFSPTAVKNAYDALDAALKDPDLVMDERGRDATFGNARQVIQREVQYRRQLQAEVNRSLREARSAMKFELSDALQGAKEFVNFGGLLDDAALEQLAGAVEQYGGVAQRRQLREIGIMVGVQRQFAGLNMQEMQRATRQLTDRENLDPDSAIAAKAAKTYVERLAALSKRDPLFAYKTVSGKPAPELFDAAGNPTAAGVRARYNYAKEAADFLGTGRVQMFTPDEQEVLGRIADEGGPKMVTLGKFIVDAVGPDDAFQAVQELGNKEAFGVAAAGAAYASGQPTFAGRIAEGQALLRNPAYPKNAYKKEDRQAVFDREMRPYMKALSPETQMRIRKAADAAFESYMKDNPGDDERATYQAVLRQATGGRLRNGAVFGGLVVDKRQIPQDVPSWMRASKWDDVIGALRPQDFTKGSLTGSPPMAGGRELTAQQMKVAKMRPTGNGRYRFYIDDPYSDNPRYVVDAEGKPYELDLNRLRGSLRQRFPNDIE